MVARLGASIEDVTFERLAPFADHRGALVPFLDTRDLVLGRARRVRIEITIRPGRIKGWGMQDAPDRSLLRRGRKCPDRALRRRPDRESHGRIAQFFFTSGHLGYWRFRPASGMPTRTGARRTYASSTPDASLRPRGSGQVRIDPHSDVIPFDWELRDG